MKSKTIRMQKRLEEREHALDRIAKIVIQCGHEKVSPKVFALLQEIERISQTKGEGDHD